MSEPKAQTIIVAEDSPPNRKILAHLLAKLGYHVLTAEDGAAAWELLKNNTEHDIVLVLSDIMMPNMDGLGLLRAVRADGRFKSLPFVLVTAVADKSYIAQAKELNVQGYVLKPVTFDRVCGKLKELFPHKTFLRPTG